MTIYWKLAVAALLIFMLAGCGGQSIPETATPELKDVPKTENTYRAQPPLPKVTAGNAEIPAVQDSYCWDYLGCRDYVGGKAMYNGLSLTVIQPGEEVKIALNYHPQPTTVEVAEIKEDNTYEAIPLAKDAFTAPTESGVYYYAFSANWMTGDGMYVLNQTSAVFALKIQ